MQNIRKELFSNQLLSSHLQYRINHKANKAAALVGKLSGGGKS